MQWYNFLGILKQQSNPLEMEIMDIFVDEEFFTLSVHPCFDIYVCHFWCCTGGDNKPQSSTFHHTQKKSSVRIHARTQKYNN